MTTTPQSPTPKTDEKDSYLRDMWNADIYSEIRIYVDMTDHARNLELELIAVQRELEEARKVNYISDHERLNWLEKTLPNGIVDTDTLIPAKWFITYDNTILASRCDNLRTAIDQAKWEEVRALRADAMLLEREKGQTK
jgi:hypothetical protein